ncbi:TIR domain-containing protein [Sphingomonas antarctica]|uniref:TIR domain-containing protein n=1 Tax=Sphingomonas antarctica TaxID=2040274 RepID=UPI0039E78DFF
MARIFISYARADREQVAPIADALAKAGHDVWWDTLIDGGTAFAKEIETQLASADAVVAVWSKTSIESDWVRDEAAAARGRKCLVPVSLDGSEAPLGFRQYHTIGLSKWRGRADAPEMDALLRGIASCGTGLIPLKQHEPRRQPVVSRRNLLMGGGVAAVAAASGAVWWLRPFGQGSSGNSVAVLPFSNLSGDPQQAYFSDGLSEEVRSALSRNARLKVAAPTSSNAFRNSDQDARAIGGKLGVAFLLQGSVRRAGDTVRVSADLIDTGSGFSKWSQTFDRKLTDIFAVQSEIAGTVAQALDSAMAPGDAGPIGGTTDVAAYEAYLRGRALLDQPTGETSDRAALKLFETAIAADPDYAAARAARSRALIVISSLWSTTGQLDGLTREAVAEAQRAIKLAPQLSDAQSALGFALAYGRLDVRGAHAPFEAARRTGQGNADVLVRYAQFATRTGDFEAARTAIERALTLDPLNSRAWRVQGALFYAQKRFAESIAPVEKALALNPKITVASAAIGDALILLGQPEAALARYRAEPGASFRLAGLAIALRRTGDTLGADAAMHDLLAIGDSASYQQAQVRAQWGQPDAALDLLDRAWRTRDSGLLYLRNDPMMDSLRANPRFTALLRDIGFA